MTGMNGNNAMNGMNAMNVMNGMGESLAFHLRNAGETEQFGEQLGAALCSLEEHPASIALLLSGDLGAGKTTFVRGLGYGMGVGSTGVGSTGVGSCDGAAGESSPIASPTFTVRMDHRGATRALIHIDAWRIGVDDLHEIGFQEALLSTAVIAIEWPERIASALPSRHIRIALDHAESSDAGTDAGRHAVITLGALTPREVRRIAESLALLVRAPRVSAAQCPVCGSRVTSGGVGSPAASASESSSAPFCSQRCRLADLGDWLAMRHRVAGTDASTSVDE